MIGAVGQSAFRLQLPATTRLHPVFHVSLLEPYVANTFSGRVVPPPLSVLVDGFEEFHIHAVLDSRFRRRKLWYLVEWEGYSAEHNTWVPVRNVHAEEAVAAYHFKYPGRAGDPQP